IPRRPLEPLFKQVNCLSVTARVGPSQRTIDHVEMSIAVVIRSPSQYVVGVHVTVMKERAALETDKTVKIDRVEIEFVVRIRHIRYVNGDLSLDRDAVG